MPLATPDWTNCTSGGRGWFRPGSATGMEDKVVRRMGETEGGCGDWTGPGGLESACSVLPIKPSICVCVRE